MDHPPPLATRRGRRPQDGRRARVLDLSLPSSLLALQDPSKPAHLVHIVHGPDGDSLALDDGPVSCLDPKLSHQVLSWEPSVDGSIYHFGSPLSSSSASSPSFTGSPPSDSDASFSSQNSPGLDMSDTTLRPTVKPIKRRPSLQSIFIPSFMQYPLRSPTLSPPSSSSASRSRSHSDVPSLPVIPPISADHDPAPPDFLLDDDPFANHSAARPLPSLPSPSHVSASGESHSPRRRPAPKKPRSPLSSSPTLARPHTSPSTPTPSTAPLPSLSPVSPVSPISASATVRHRRPAHTRPAFAPRPSLPSLRTLAESDFVYPIKARKGTLGARLPLEPWDMDHEVEAPTSKEPDTPVEPPASTSTDSYPELDDTHTGPDRRRSSENDDHDPHPIADVAAAWTPHKDTLTHVSTDNEDDATLVQSPVSLDFALDGHLSTEPPEGDAMLSLYELLSSFTTPSHTRSSSASSTSTFSPSSISSPDKRSSDDLSHGSSESDRSAPSSEPSSSDDQSPLYHDDLPRSSSQSPDLAYVPYTSFQAMPGSFPSADEFEPGTSAGTVRGAIHSMAGKTIDFPEPEDEDNWRSSYDEEFDLEYYDAGDDEYFEDDVAPADADHYDRRGGGGQYRDDGRGGSRDLPNNRSGGGGGGSSRPGGGSGGGAGGGRDGGDDRRRDDRQPPSKSAFSSSSDPDTEDEEDEEDVKRPAARAAPPKPSANDSANTDDDDVPLAQRIPTALRAQRTIRRQVRDENDERRRQRALRQAGESKVSPIDAPVTRSATHKIASSSPPTTRARTATLPSSSPAPFAVDELAKRLQSVQAHAIAPSAPASPNPPRYHSSTDSYSAQPDELGRKSTENARGLRPMRSFHHTGAHMAEPASAPMPTSYSHGRVGRSATTKPRRESFDVNPASASLHHRSKSSRRAHDEGRPSTSSGYPEPRAEVRTQVAWQQRVFIEDMQRYNMLEIDPTTTARDVIRMLERQKQLEERKGAGGWMLFEVAHDFGMERPIRGFEIVSEVVNSWDKDKSVNFLVAKMTPLAVLLHPSTMPSSSPRHNGYVEWESKKGKWNKRWLELREHGLWLSKKDNGKDETFLCSLANFDAYTVTRLHKSPKPFVFAVKSTDNLTFFENAADYVHVFCCPDKDGQKWLEGILLARSYVINQERNIISTTSMPPSSAGPGKSLSRSGTRKGARPAQPLVNVSAPSSLPAMPAGNVFEPGSLLAKR